MGMLAPGSAIGRYVVKRKLAEGGMAEIYLASALGPEGFSKDVVLKVVRRFLAQDSQFTQMFIAEARLASRLNHANVVQIFDFGKHGETYYLAMEYVRGASLWDLRQRCREQGVPFPPTLAAEIAAQVARGLQYAHSITEAGQKLGVVHRDVTPHNVLLSFDGAVKLTDFGIAKATTTQTAPGMLKGKFAYMSPEQSRGEKVDARTDIFALGIVLWELLTGGRLFDGDSDVAVLRAVQDALIPPASRLNPDVPPELSAIVARALARPPAERYQSAFEFERALATFVLRSANTVEDTSVALFLRQLCADDVSTPGEPAPAPGGAAAGQSRLLDDTHLAARPGSLDPTLTSTPVSPGPGRPASAKPLGPLPEAMHARETEDFVVYEPGRDTVPSRPAALSAQEPPRARTEEMPAPGLRPLSRRLEPLPVEVSVSEGGPAAPTASTSVAEPSAPRADEGVDAIAPLLRSRTPAVVAGALALAGLAVTGVWAMRSGSEPLADAPGVAEVRAKAPAEPALRPPTPEGARAPLPAPEAPAPPGTAHAAPAPATPVTQPPSAPPPDLAGPAPTPPSPSTALQTPPPAEPTPAAGAPGSPSAPPAEGTVVAASAPPPARRAVPSPDTTAAGEARAAPAEAAPGVAPVAARPETPTRPGAEPRAPAPAPGPASPARVAASPTRRPARLGTLSVRAEPFATVTLPGRAPVEITGRQDVPAPAGTYEITLRHPRKTERQQVTVSPGSVTQVTFSAN